MSGLVEICGHCDREIVRVDAHWEDAQSFYPEYCETEDDPRGGVVGGRMHAPRGIPPMEDLVAVESWLSR